MVPALHESEETVEVMEIVGAEALGWTGPTSPLGKDRRGVLDFFAS